MMLVLIFLALATLIRAPALFVGGECIRDKGNPGAIDPLSALSKADDEMPR